MSRSSSSSSSNARDDSLPVVRTHDIVEQLKLLKSSPSASTGSMSSTKGHDLLVMTSAPSETTPFPTHNHAYVFVQENTAAAPSALLYVDRTNNPPTISKLSDEKRLELIKLMGDIYPHRNDKSVVSILNLETRFPLFAQKAKSITGYPPGSIIDQFSILNNETVSFRDAREIAELHVATGMAPKTLVAFRPERAAWHEAILSVTTRVRVEDEEDMQKKVKQIYAQAIQKPTFDVQMQQLKEYREKIQKEIENFIYESGSSPSLTILQKTEIAAFKQKCQAKEKDFGQYVHGFNADKAVIHFFTDKIYSEMAAKVTRAMMTQELAEAFDQKKFQRIPQRKEDRCLFMVAGGPASGKGSSVMMLKRVAVENGIDWMNVVKTNGDSYKPLFLEPGTTTAHLYSQLAQEEAGLMKQAVQTRLEKLTRAGITPHVFVDQTAMGKDRLDMALDSGGKAYVAIVSTDVADAIRRADERGRKEGTKGRFEHTEMLLNTHRQTTLDSQARIAECAGKNVLFNIIDNNVAKGESPILVMAINFKTHQAVIHDEEKLNNFLKKISIDPKATSADGVYNSAKSMTIEDYLKPLLQRDPQMKVSLEDGRIYTIATTVDSKPAMKK